MRHKPVRLIERLLGRLTALQLASSTELLAHLLEEQEDVLEQVVRQANQYVDTIEDRLLTSRVKRNRAELGRMRRMLLRFQRLLAPEPAALMSQAAATADARGAVASAARARAARTP